MWPTLLSKYNNKNGWQLTEGTLSGKKNLGLFKIQSGVESPSNPGVRDNGNGLCTKGLCGLVANSANSVSRLTPCSNRGWGSFGSSFDEGGG